mgnify:CR=1 FL=1
MNVLICVVPVVTQIGLELPQFQIFVHSVELITLSAYDNESAHPTDKIFPYREYSKILFTYGVKT